MEEVMDPKSDNASKIVRGNREPAVDLKNDIII